ncbi:NADH-quinone oxidoreductase subunit A [Fervidibacillus halotolerans]|uniref:NADH-quinone oxidoreductase subunit A n=1 Tax=Fervidibacillus halotolerans TaxID=2980027 RepID=A0A9E8LZ06_9BACI|nr:NADH-quinone oxidoreductase subunit A [Fervidibacillus halotolerans]WAA12171.1 NADH-quinone oxidoreductase subunit A [Fervidibacillus halotolerans]
MNSFYNSYLLIITFFIIALSLPILSLSIGKWLRPPSKEGGRGVSYESGIEPFHDSRIQFSPQYYLFALLFVIFDIEVIFLFPWAVAYGKLGMFALIEMLIFTFMLCFGLIYAWKKKVLEWM